MSYDLRYDHNGHEYAMLLVAKNTAIQVVKDGKNAYLIKKDWCTCDGYKYRRKCSHYDHATTEGLIKRLVKETKPELGSTSSFIDDSRRKSITEYGKKNGWKQDMIEWAIVRMADFVRKNKSVDDMVKAFKKEKSNKK